MSTTSGRKAHAALIACLLPLLAACVETGDFGRVKSHSTWNDVLGATGSVAARLRDDPTSDYRLTDDERVLRDRAWRFLVPAHERALLDRGLADLAAKRILPPEFSLSDPTAYHRALLVDWSESPASRYRRLGEDAAADARLLPALAEVARRVLVADGVRLKTLAYARHVGPSEAANAEGRVAENRCLLAWVRAGLDSRLLGYRYALERLVIETPQADAVPAERSLTLLERTGAVMDSFGVAPLPACSGGAVVIEPAPFVAAPLRLKG